MGPTVIPPTMLPTWAVTARSPKVPPRFCSPANNPRDDEQQFPSPEPVREPAHEEVPCGEHRKCKGEIVSGRRLGRSELESVHRRQGRETAAYCPGGHGTGEERDQLLPAHAVLRYRRNRGGSMSRVLTAGCATGCGDSAASGQFQAIGWGGCKRLNLEDFALAWSNEAEVRTGGEATGAASS
jgi:hypothetical protein